MTENSIWSIFGLFRKAFDDSAKRIANIYTIFCNSGQRGVVDTFTLFLSSVKDKCRICTAQSLSLFFFFFFFLFFLFCFCLLLLDFYINCGLKID